MKAVTDGSKDQNGHQTKAEEDEEDEEENEKKARKGRE